MPGLAFEEIPAAIGQIIEVRGIDLLEFDAGVWGQRWFHDRITLALLAGIASGGRR